jgi:hypothetical protein
MNKIRHNKLTLEKKVYIWKGKYHTWDTMGKEIKGEKSPVIALILNLCIIFVPVGHFYIGQWQKAIVLWIIIWLVPFVGIPAVWIAGIVDVFLQASTMNKGKSVGHWTFFTGEYKH